MKSTVSFITTILMIIAGLFGSAALAQNGNDLSGTAWQLITVNGGAVLDGTNITLTFGEDGRVSGSAGCNGYGASYSVSGTDISIGMAFSTMMACVTPGVMEQERAYLDALQTATGYEIAEGQLILTYGAGEQLVFAPLLPLAGTSWRLVTLGGEDTAAVITLTFGENQASGSGGCNTYTTTYAVEAGTLRFEPVFSTRRACLDEVSSAQETAYFAALETAAAYELSDAQLIITYGEGDQLVFAAQPILANTQWQLVTLGGAEAAAGTQVTLEFGADAAVTGSTGCNSYRTTYSQEGDTLTFDERIITTRRACLDTASADQEQAFLEALRTATTYTLQADQLTIVYGDGQQLVFAPLSR
jgi:heat shock protein HslJ